MAAGKVFWTDVQICRPPMKQQIVVKTHDEYISVAMAQIAITKANGELYIGWRYKDVNLIGKKITHWTYLEHGEIVESVFKKAIENDRAS